MKVKGLVAQSYWTLCDPMDCILPGSSTHGILQARILEWVAIPISRGSSWPMAQTRVSCTASRFFTMWATTKINSKWIQDLNVRLDTIKLFEENIGRTLFDINCSNIFFDLSPRVTEIKTKIKQWDLIQLKSFCIIKETKNKTKQKKWGFFARILANNATDKGLTSKIYKQLI